MSLEDRIKHQFPALFITLLSVLIGLVFSDLASEAHARMTLWPLNLGTLRTWGQIFAMGTNALGVWIVFAHVGISRLRIPSLADSIIVFLVPIPLLFANALVGQKDIWPWFYYASGYLLIAFATWLWQVRMASAESELASFARLTHPLGPALVLYTGIPFFAAAGWAGHALSFAGGHDLLAESPDAGGTLVLGGCSSAAGTAPIAGGGAYEGASNTRSADADSMPRHRRGVSPAGTLGIFPPSNYHRLERRPGQQKPAKRG